MMQYTRTLLRSPGISSCRGINRAKPGSSAGFFSNSTKKDISKSSNKKWAQGSKLNTDYNDTIDSDAWRSMSMIDHEPVPSNPPKNIEDDGYGLNNPR